MKAKVWIVGISLLLTAPFCLAYSFLTHETLIDIEWDSSIKPLLLNRFPNATPAELREARAYAYGGSTIPPLGLRQNILAFDADPNAPIATKRHARQWRKVQEDLAILQQLPATRIPDAK